MTTPQYRKAVKGDEVECLVEVDAAETSCRIQTVYHAALAPHTISRTCTLPESCAHAIKEQNRNKSKSLLGLSAQVSEFKLKFVR